MRPRVVTLELEVFVVEVEEILHVGIDAHLGQRTWGARELEACLIEVVKIEVGVASGVDKVARFQS